MDDSIKDKTKISSALVDTPNYCITTSQISIKFRLQGKYKALLATNVCLNKAFIECRNRSERFGDKLQRTEKEKESYGF